MKTKDVKDAADNAGILWDYDPVFMMISKGLTGTGRDVQATSATRHRAKTTHIDKMTDLRKVNNDTGQAAYVGAKMI